MIRLTQPNTACWLVSHDHVYSDQTMTHITIFALNHQPPSALPTAFDHLSLITMPACSNCQEDFDTRGQRDYHLAKCKDIITLQYPNGLISLKRDDRGQFMCCCAHINCPKPFSDARGLKKHITRASQPWVGPVNVSTTPTALVHLWHIKSRMRAALVPLSAQTVMIPPRRETWQSLQCHMKPPWVPFNPGSLSQIEPMYQWPL